MSGQTAYSATRRGLRVVPVLLLCALCASAGRVASGGDDAPARDRSLQTGAAAFARGDWDAATAAYRRAATLSPRSVGAWLGLQRVAVAAGRWDDALSAGREAIRLGPDGYTARARQAYARYMRGDYLRAERLYAGLLRDWPDDAEIQLGLGFALARLGEVERARVLRDEAALEIPHDARLPALDALLERASFHVYASFSATYQAFILRGRFGKTPIGRTNTPRSR